MNSKNTIKIPNYTKGEEVFNMVTHIVGGGIGITATVLCVIFAALHSNPWAVVGSAIYGAMIIVLYTMSSIYHGLSPRLTAKKVFRVIDHCSIFLLIAGTYTPIALAKIRPVYPVTGWVIFGVVWGVAILGIVANAISIEKFKVFSMICYIGLGWCVVFAWNKTVECIDFWGIVLLLAGGIAYTIGAVLYGIGKKKKYMHSIFHIFVCIGTLLQFFCILFYVV
ncbi:MAG: hemolysin III family protein [Clostridia bacterium]|nr:hemolysin III family protein [Clostridia bacterium]MBQ4327158.1 hemolysin III family protein [Clostridia bacterium]